MGMAGGEGKVGEKGEGFTAHLMVVLARREVDGGGSSTAEVRLTGGGAPAGSSGVQPGVQH